MGGGYVLFVMVVVVVWCYIVDLFFVCGEVLLVCVDGRGIVVDGVQLLLVVGVGCQVVGYFGGVGYELWFIVIGQCGG